MEPGFSVSSEAAFSAGSSHPVQRITHAQDDGLSAFMSVRPRLFGIAYRMLGSSADAEDLVQDVWVRWQLADRRPVRDVAAFLVTTAKRLAINVIRSARLRRETPVESGMQEPVDTGIDPRSTAERHEALACGVQMLLERLTPTERAAYILREAFDYSYRDIASLLCLEEANARQVVTRARQHVMNGRPMPASPAEQRHLMEAFAAAASGGDITALQRALRAGRRRPESARRSLPRSTDNDLIASAAAL